MGFSRSPNGLPEDRAKIVDDPIGQRGKVVQVEWRAGDNFRTSGGTEPRSWFSNCPGHEFRPGTNVSHAFGIMFNQADTNHCFGQIISSDGPVWMLILEGSGLLTVFCDTCGGNTLHMTLEPKKWYDFRVDMDFRVGGAVRFSSTARCSGWARSTAPAATSPAGTAATTTGRTAPWATARARFSSAT